MIIHFPSTLTTFTQQQIATKAHSLPARVPLIFSDSGLFSITLQPAVPIDNYKKHPTASGSQWGVLAGNPQRQGHVSGDVIVSFLLPPRLLLLFSAIFLVVLRWSRGYKITCGLQWTGNYSARARFSQEANRNEK